MRKQPSQEFRVRQSPSQEFRPPPRKSSLTGERRPSIPSLKGQASATPPPQQEERVLSRRSPASTQESSPKLEQAPSLPFVRPADIYRRVEEEKERQRASMDSGRPSLDSIEPNSRPTSKSAQPARSSQDSAREATAGSFLKPTLDPVAERKSEYGLDGFIAQDPAFAAALGTQVSSEEPANPPSLPQLDRFSSFGMDSIGLTEDKKRMSEFNQVSDKSQATEQQQLDVQGSAASIPTHLKDSDLQHTPSLGFRSAVDKAFDGDSDNSTFSPTSGHGSQRSKEGSDVSRSNTSDSTGGISPIMSRVPSAATAEKRVNESNLRVVNTPSMVEEAAEPNSPESRPDSSGTLKGPFQAPGHVSGHHSRSTSAESGHGAVQPGYRRSMRPPSTGESPAHVTAISSRKEVAERSHEGEIAMTTPTDSAADDDYAEDQQKTPDASATNLVHRESDIAATAKSRSNTLTQTSPVAKAETNAQKSFMEAHRGHAPGISTDFARSPESPVSRSASPSKGRVRDLATKYNEIHGTNRSRAGSPSGSVSSWSSGSRMSPVGGKDDAIKTDHSTQVDAATTLNQRGKGDNSDLAPPPRPAMPGGWISYAGSEASGMQSGSDNYESATEPELEQRSQSQLPTPRMNRGMSSDSVDLTPNTAKQPLVGKNFESITQTPMAALTEAGAALAQSVKHATNFDEQPKASGIRTPEQRTRTSTGATQKPTSAIFGEPSATSSSAAPTPPAKDSPREQPQPEASGYFAATPPLNIRKESPEPIARVDSQEPDSAASASTHLSLDPSASDTESDRLRKEIARSLSPPSLAPVAERQSAASSIFPSEYDAYWANQEDGDFSGPATKHSGESPTKNVGPAPAGSLESTRVDGPRKDSLTQRPPRTSISGQRPSGEYTQSPKSVHFGATSEPRTSTDPGKRSLDQSLPPYAVSDSPVELESPPPPLSKSLPAEESTPTPVELPTPDEKSSQAGVRPMKGPGTGSTTPATRSRQGTNVAGSQPQPRNFKDIVNMKNSGDRADSFNQARNQWAAQSTGLNDWLAHMIKTNPEHTNAVSAPMRPIVNTSGLAGSVRNKMPPGIAKLGKIGTGDPQSASTPDSANTASPQIRDSPSVSKRQEFLHQGKMFGGKASQGAKGLLAKGKSRFKDISANKVE